MADKTQLNQNLTHNSIATVINREQAAPDATVLNPSVAAPGIIAPGTTLRGRYRVTEKMDIAAGEADLYVCVCQDRQYVAKIYRREVAIKAEVSSQLRQLDCPYVAKVFDTFQHNGMSVEILPYYSRGSLQGKRFTYEQLRSRIIPCLNEGLKALHDVGIVHKDLKPSNIMITDDSNSIAIIDFGISSVTDPNSTIIVTKTGMTPAYSAPETFRGLFSSNADYYSLGITLYELFCGTTPYQGLSAEQIEQYHALQRIPFPQDMPPALRDLIKALTYFDLSNRNNKNNPNRRWGYEEVRKWLAGVEQTLPGEGVGPRPAVPYRFNGRDYTSRTELVRALVQSWDNGKKQLFRGMLSNHYKSFDTQAWQICSAAENEASQVSGKDDLIFWKTMYALAPDSKDFFWKGRRYASLPAMARELLDCLRRNDAAMADFMESVFSEKLMSAYVTMKYPDNTQMLKAVQGLETTHRAYAGNPRNRRINLYLTAYLLSGQRILYIADQEFHTLDELTTYMKNLLGENNEHLDEFRKFCHQLVDHYDHLVPSFESWLIALGKREALERWKSSRHTAE